MLSVHHLSAGYTSAKGDAFPVLADISIDIPRGQICSVLGPSGCGKSTFLYAIISGDVYQTGRVTMSGLPLDTLRTSGRISFVEQSPFLLEWLSVSQNITLPLSITRQPVDTHFLDYIYDQLKLGAFKDSFPKELSGGMRARVALARSLATKPQLLLLDEAFSNLDEVLRLDLQLLVRTVVKDANTTVLAVSHSVVESIAFSDRIIVLQGRPVRTYTDHSTADAPTSDIEDLVSFRYTSLYSELIASLRASHALL